MNRDNQIYFQTNRSCPYCRRLYHKYNIQIDGRTTFYYEEEGSNNNNNKSKTLYRCSMVGHDLTLKELLTCPFYPTSRLVL